MDLIHANGCELAGVLIALNRQEKRQGELSAIQEVATGLQCTCHCDHQIGGFSCLKHSLRWRSVLEKVKHIAPSYGVLVLKNTGWLRLACICNT